MGFVHGRIKAFDWVYWYMGLNEYIMVMFL